MVAASNPLPRGFLIDSGVFIAAERHGFDLGGLLRDHPQLPHAMSSVTAAELLIGAQLSSPARRALRQKRAEEYFAAFAILDFDLQCARQWALSAVELRSQGRPIGAHDLLIAATALRHGYAVITFNLDEFSRVPNLTAISPLLP